MESVIIRILFINFEESSTVDCSLYVHQDVISSIVKYREGGWVINPPKGYRIRKDRADNQETSQEHIHIYVNGQIVAINKDGSRHDRNGEKPIRLPNKIYEWIKKNLGGYPLPADKTIQLKVMPIPKFQISFTVDLDNKIIWKDDGE